MMILEMAYTKMHCRILPEDKIESFPLRSESLLFRDFESVESMRLWSVSHSLQTGLKSLVAFNPNGLSSFVFKKKFPFKFCGVA